MGCLILGGTSILLHPEGNMQIDYLTRVISREQVSYMHSVPSHLSVICEYLELTKTFDRLITLRSLCSSGEPMNVRCLATFRKQICADIFNLYGPAECTDVSIYKIDQKCNIIQPTCIGHLSSNLTCCILDNFGQAILPNGQQMGELYVSGPTVFPGYFNRDDLTQHVITKLEVGRLYYKTGDLVKLDNKGLLHYVGRQDFMVKLYGQRIELYEIEQTIVNASPHVSKCVVIKHTYHEQEYLIAFVQASETDVNVALLREKCQQQLPPFMIPTMFLLLPQFPVTENGKIDRARLPLNNISFGTIEINHHIEQPKTSMEQQIHSIWCNILRIDSIPSTRTSLFAVGGNSLLIIKLYSLYQMKFPFDQRTLSIGLLFRYPTIQEHARLLTQHTTNAITCHDHWKSFGVSKGFSNNLNILYFLFI